MIYQIVNTRTDNVVVQRALVAKTLMQRLKGLMFKENMPKNEALIFYSASCIHTCFMRFAIDLVYLDKDNKVMKIYNSINPWRLAYCLGSKTTLELAGGTASQAALRLGDTLELRRVSA